jgi:D-alanyl-D-alanine carboxypeptidase
MVHLGWKLPLGGLLVVLLVLLLISRLVRSVPPYHPPAERTLGTWGSVDRETAERLQATLDDDLNLLEAPGLQAFVRTPEGETWSGTSGTVDLRRKTPLRREHTLRVGSVTKTFTALLILQLVEEGYLSLDDPLAKWFPDLPNAGVITVRQLLNHTSGLPEYLPKVVMKSIIPSTYWTPQALWNSPKTSRSSCPAPAGPIRMQTTSSSG